MGSSSLVRSWLGVVLKDLPRYIPALSGGGREYLALCNRNELLQPAPDGTGYRCLWRWTSDLHAPKVMPRLGSCLMRRALTDHPIVLRESPAARGRPAVSFVIGHRGDARRPHLLKTLESIAGQHDVDVECVVVEQDVHARLRGRLPDWVRYVHTPPPPAAMPFCRSWAFNIGARHAHGELLVLHDNDLLVPADYAARSLRRIRDGFDVVNLKRFGFYLSEAHTDDVFAGRADLIDRRPDSIMQNTLGGGSIAIARAAYLSIGGMDEGFVGWGGEDNEFWERAQTLRVWSYGFLPYVHLWHPAEAGKYDGANPTQARYQRLAAIDPGKRIAALLSISSGELSGPAEWTAGSVHEREPRPASGYAGNIHAGVRA